MNEESTLAGFKNWKLELPGSTEVEGVYTEKMITLSNVSSGVAWVQP